MTRGSTRCGSHRSSHGHQHDSRSTSKTSTLTKGTGQPGTPGATTFCTWPFTHTRIGRHGHQIGCGIRSCGSSVFRCHSLALKAVT
jgi:hypothetical protein